MNKQGQDAAGRSTLKAIGVPNAEEHLIKAQLVFKIEATMRARRLKQIEVAELFGIRQSDVSKILRGEFRQFAVERLLSFLVSLHQDVGIVVKPHRHRSGAASSHAR